MPEILAALYARVSSEQQADEHTINSQVAALRTRVSEDGLRLAAEREFLDEGYSGATLLRPALERLRDLRKRQQVREHRQMAAEMSRFNTRTALTSCEP